MAVLTMRCNLAAAIFPFATELWGRSIIIPGYDQNYDRTTLNAPGVIIDKGIPQVFYMHNCMPTSQGYQSIGYKTVFPGITAQDFDQAIPIFSSTGNEFVFSPSSGKNYIVSMNDGKWIQASPFFPGTVPDDVLVTTAFVHGITYICYSKYGVFKYNESTKALDSVVLVGLDMTQVLGIASSNGYMIAWTTTAVAWSNLTDETDFVPNLATGAGGGSVNEAKGPILACLAISGGFIIYCHNNACSARYSGNVQFPFIIREIPGAGGVSDVEQISWQSNMPAHYVWGTDGIQKIDLSTATSVFPETTDFLANKIFEDFDEETLLLSSQYIDYPIYSKINVVSARYLIISYGLYYPEFTHCLVFDLLLNRWGKLKITHRDCFQWDFPNLFGPVTYGQLGSAGIIYNELKKTTYGELLTTVTTPDVFKQNVAFLQGDGTIKTVVFDYSEKDSNGVFILGKFQLARGNLIEHQSCDVEVVSSNNQFDYYLLTSYDGKTLQPAQKAFLDQTSPKTRAYRKMLSGVNFSCLYIGQFNLTSVVLSMTVGGDFL